MTTKRVLIIEYSFVFATDQLMLHQRHEELGRSINLPSIQKCIVCDSEATEIAATAAWIGAKLHDLSPAIRAELVHLIEGMGNHVRLERMMGNIKKRLCCNCGFRQLYDGL